MTSGLQTFNDTLFITKAVEYNSIDNIISYIKRFDNVIDIMTSVKVTRFHGTRDFVSVSRRINGQTANVIIDSDRFLPNIPTHLKNFSTIVKFGDHSIPFELPKIEDASGKYSPDLSEYPIEWAKKVDDQLHREFINRLNETYIVKSDNKDTEDKFVFSFNGIMNLLGYIMDFSVDSLETMRFMLMKECNFQYSDFNEITVDEAHKNYKLLERYISDEQNSAQ